MTTKNILMGLGGLIAVGILAVVGVLVYLDVTGGDSEATKDIEDVLVEVDAETIAQAGAGARVFEILPDESEARFEIGETLAGERITVVGTTSGAEDVIGQIVIDTANPQAAQVGTMTVNLKTLETETGRPGDSQRDDAIRSRILRTNQPEYEFSTFVPTSVTGLPATVAVGEAFSFQVTGDFTLVDATNPTTFDITVTPISDTRIEGTATTVVRYADYGISINAPRQVADISDEVTIIIDFVAEELVADPGAVATASPFGA